MNINREVPAPYAVQLEPVEGCSLACSFCGIQSIRENGADADLKVHGKNSAPYRFMELSTLERVASEAANLGWNPRWEFAMHGEPTMHPRLAEMIKIVRFFHKKGYIMVTTNGSGLLKDTVSKIEGLFHAGLNTLALDDYKHSSLGPGKPTYMQQIRKAIDDDFVGFANVSVHEYPKDPEGNPHHRHNKRKLTFIHDISENEHGNHQLTNQGGSSFAAVKTLEERCAKPFRELSVRWDGNVAVCCDDWPGTYKVANVNDTPLDDLWYHPRFEAARRMLYAADRRFGPCKGCNVRTARNGLLPDKLGKSEMEPVDAETRALLGQAQRGRVFTIKLAKGD